MFLTKLKIVVTVSLALGISDVGIAWGLQSAAVALSARQAKVEQGRPKQEPPPKNEEPKKGETKELSAMTKARADAARQAYEIRWARFSENLRNSRFPNNPRDADVESLYRWSRRWLESERVDKKADRIAAYQAHLNRIKDVANCVNKAVEQEKADTQISAVREVVWIEVLATKFYLAEAELWLAQAKGE
jgi:hypothetical protein